MRDGWGTRRRTNNGNGEMRGFFAALRMTNRGVAFREVSRVAAGVAIGTRRSDGAGGEGNGVKK